MRTFASSELRDVVLVGHGGSGKTTLADAILYAAGITQRLGRVDDDTSTFDYEPEEHKHKSTISAAAGHVEWKKTKINLVDTSGHGNFLVDTRIAVEIGDAGVVVVAAPDGVQVYTERTCAMLDERAMPRCFYVGKMDRERADFEHAVEAIRSLSDKALPIHLPIGSGVAFSGLVDLVQMKALRFEDEGRAVKVGAIPAELVAPSKAAREKLTEAVAAADDALLERYLEAGTLGEEEFQRGFAMAVKRRALYPILVGAPGIVVGVQPLLDLIVTAFPSPSERPAWRGKLPPLHGQEGTVAERAPDPEAPVAAYVWKTVNSEIGRLSLLRVLSGRLGADTNLLSVNHDKREHLGQLYSLQGKARDGMSEALPGDLVAVAKLKVTRTGDTLADDRQPFLADHPTAPAPMISYAIRPRSKGDEDKLGLRLAEIVDADVAIKVSHDPQSKEVLLGGLGQIHIEVTVEKLHRMGVDVELMPPHIPYLETIKGTAKNVEGKHKKQTGGKGQYGVVYIDLAPLSRGGGFQFEDGVVGGTVPRQFIPAVEKGIRNRMGRGVVAGFPVTDVKVRLFDGKYHDVDSDSRSFEIAGSKAFQAAFKQARPCLLEPVMRLEVHCPEESMGAIVGDLNHRRGQVEGMEVQGKNQVVKALVPMAETLKYASDLRSITGGRGSFSMEFSHYTDLPPHLAEKVIAEAKVAHEEEE